MKGKLSHKAVTKLIFLAVLAAYFGADISYGANTGWPIKKTTVIRGIVRDKSKPAGQGNIARAKVKLLSINNHILASTLTDKRGVYTLKLKLASGYYNLACAVNNYAPIEVTRYIPNGRFYISGFDFALRFIDRIPPVIKVKPVPAITNQNVRLEYSVSDNITPADEIKVMGDQSPYTKEGEYKVTLAAKDKAGNSSKKAVKFTIDKTPPAVVITSPKDSSTVKDSAIQMQGTIDKKAFSETCSLKPGKNTLTKTAADLAGNTASASITVHYNKPIEPKSEKVTSADSKIKETPPAAKNNTASSSKPQVNSSADKTPLPAAKSSSNNNSTVQPQTAIDEKPLSQTDNLNSENNTLAKTVTVSAENTASGSYLYDTDTASRFIGYKGGEVLSKDGRVKIIISEGALEKDTLIELYTLDSRDFEGLVSKDDVILTIVECKPYNQAFKSGATLIYTLDKTEVPGTLVKLGLYRDENGKKVTVEALSQVETDGRTVRFSLLHFSTYAAIKNLSSAAGAPIGGGVQIPLPDMFSGAFSSSIPLAVPPARAGMQPSLSFTYRSSNPNSWLGTGFSLNPGQIVHSTRLGPPAYDDIKDTFYFVSDNGTTELVHLKDNLYQAKIESSFTKFFKQTDDSWKIIGKDGSTLYFGQTSDSKETSPKGTFSWYLTKAQDTNSNYIEYEYTKDQNKSYLKQINYTGSQSQGIQPSNTVKFYLEDRTDLISSYISSNRIATAKRLKEIKVYTNSQLVWCYKLEYEYSQDTNRSLLKRIRQLSADNKELPVQSFEYQRIINNE